MSSTAPGWYPDPDPNAPPGRQRWYSGADWTDHVGSPEPPAPAFPAAPAYTATATPHAVAGYPTQTAVAPAAPTGFPGYGAQPWGAAPQQIVVGSMSKKEFKKLPRKVRLDYDRADIDLALGRNRAGTYARSLGILSIFINPLCLVSITAIVRGAQGRRHAREWAASGYPALGYGSATAGLILGIVTTVLWPLALYARIAG